MTYRQLDAKANQLANFLRTQGVGPEVLVGICVERSLEMVVGLLGILKAGGAYVPLDPDYPAERLAFMLRDAHAPVLLTQERLRFQFAAAGRGGSFAWILNGARSRGKARWPRRSTSSRRTWLTSSILPVRRVNPRAR